MRKTLSVKQIVDQANEQLAGWSRTAEEREGIIGMVRFVLSEADAYAGFSYLTFAELSQRAFDCAQYNLNESGTVVDVRPGVRHTDERMVDGVDTWFADTDPTRIMFYLPSKLLY